MNETDIFDMTEENKPQKVMSQRTKKKLIFLLCAVIGIIIAVGIIIVLDVFITGAPTPQEAVAKYQTASFVYDIADTLEYASEYTKTELNGNQRTNDKELKRTLETAWSNRQTTYSKDKITCKLVSVVEYEKGEGRFDEITKDYASKGDIDKVKKAALVKMTIHNGSYETTKEYVAVKCGMRWYYMTAYVSE